MLSLLLPLACLTGRGAPEPPAAAALPVPSNPRAAVLSDALADCHAERCGHALARGSDTLREAFDAESLSAYLGERYAILGAPRSVQVVRELRGEAGESAMLFARVRFEHGDLLGRAVLHPVGEGWALSELDMPVPLTAARPPQLDALRAQADGVVEDAWSGRSEAVAERFGGTLAEPGLSEQLSEALSEALSGGELPRVAHGEWSYDRGAWRVEVPHEAGDVTLAFTHGDGAWRVVGVELAG